MPLRRMPSLSALRAFEAAARRLSFKEAASELAVTPGAVSQQIRSLEDELGVSLFARATRSVTLTEAGRNLQPAVTDGFMQIREAVDLVRPEERPALSVMAAGMVIRNWLLPRLHHFTGQQPEISTSVKTLHSWEPFTPAENEVAIRLAKTPPPNVYARKIHSILLIPLASPDFIKRHGVTTSSDALRAPLLQDAVIQLFLDRTGWELWFEAAGLSKPVPNYALNFDPISADFALDMAIEGKGLLLGWSIQCYHALSQGRVVSPFGPVIEPGLNYYLVCRKGQERRPHVKAFLDWAEQEAAILSTLQSLYIAAG
ncbi:MAG: LysR family transcriptional regulator [Pseudomonadota bacterium]